MSKESLHQSGKRQESIKFAQFWVYIGAELGSSRLRFQANAKSINDFLYPHDLHQAFLKELIFSSYKRSHCYHLNAAINVNAVLDILGETAHQLKGTNSDDLLDIEMLEEICWLITERYSKHIDLPEPLFKHTPEKHVNAIASLPLRRIRRANRKL